MPKRTEYNHLSKEEAIYLVDRLNNGETPRQENRLKFNNIVVFKENGYPRYFSVPTKDDLEKVCLKIVLERSEDNYYCFNDKEDKPEKPDVSLEDANKMKDSNIKTVILQTWKDYDYEVKQHENDIRLKKNLERIVKEKDGKLALQFLCDMKGGEYDGFEVITTENY